MLTRHDLSPNGIKININPTQNMIAITGRSQVEIVAMLTPIITRTIANKVKWQGQNITAEITPNPFLLILRPPILPLLLSLLLYVGMGRDCFLGDLHRLEPHIDR